MFDSNIGTFSKSLTTNSNCVLVWTNINSTIPLFKIISLFYFSIPPLMHLLRIDSFIPNFGYAPPQKLKINYLFQYMMYYICLVFVFLLSHHSLGLVDYFSSSSSSSLFELIVRPIILFCLLPIILFSQAVITVIFIHT